MMIHDWTRVDDGIFHDFHLAWIAELRRALNGGILPRGVYALAEQVAQGANPEVIAMEEPIIVRHDGDQEGSSLTDPEPARLLTDPRAVRFTCYSERADYKARRRDILIWHRSNYHVLALIEIVSAGN